MKRVFIALVALVALSVSGCDEWTTPENLGSTDAVNRSTASSAELKSYKRSDHKVSIAHILTAPTITQQYQRLVALPDSLDFACIKNPVGASASLKSEIKEVYDKKGTRTLCFIDFMSIVNAWEDMIPVGETDNRTPEEFVAYCKVETTRQLDCFEQYGYHGIVVSYQGRTLQPGQAEFLELVEAWRGKHTKMPMLFRGNWWSLPDQTILSDCDYIIAVPTNVSPSATSLTATFKLMDEDLRNNIKEQVPTDRFVWETVLKPVEDNSPVGVQIGDVAQWAIAPLTTGTPIVFTKAGLAVDNAWIDYYNGMNYVLNTSGARTGAVENTLNNADNTYKRIRDAINVLSEYFEVPLK